jgi:signal transduction histidine kinase
MAVTEDRTPSPGRAELFDVFVGMLSEVDADSDGPPSNAFHDRLCEAVCRLTAMERAVLFLYDPADRRAEVAGAHGIDRDRLSELEVTLEDAPMARRALAEDRVVVASERIEDEVTAAYARLFGVTTLTCTPLAASGRWLGVLFADRGGGRFHLTDEERHAMWTLGKTAALASSAWLVTREQEHARRLSERLDFAREIHDRVIQRLFGVSLALGADGSLSATARERCRDELHAALTELRSALRRPLEIERPRVDGSLREDLDRASRRPQHPVTVDWQPGLAIPRSLDRLARAVLAEALRNATKHARPRTIAAAVADRDGELVLTVRNDGVLHRRAQPGPGLGLRLVALEAIARGGRVDAGPVQPKGWEVRFAVPLEEREAA